MLNSQQKQIILLLFLFISQGYCMSKQKWQELIDNQLNKTIPQGSKRNLVQLEEINWQPIRISYEYLVSPDINPETVSTVLEIAKSYFTQSFLVQQIQSSFSFEEYSQNSQNTNQCLIAIIPDNLLTKRYASSDIVLFVTIKESDEGYLAYAGPCLVYSDFRPLFGLINFNYKYFNTTNLSEVQFEKNIETTIHEIFHALGFIQNFFKYYFDSDTMQIYPQVTNVKNGIIYLQTPRIIAEAKNYFNCSNITGFPMEDQGGTGTADNHWERRLLGNELMTGSDLNGDFLISLFTYKILQDSGWYRLGDVLFDNMIHGRGKGCDFFKNGCKYNQYPEFCKTARDVACTYSRTGIGSCKEDSLANSCLTITIFSNTDCRDQNNQKKNYFLENFDYNSKCFEGSISNEQLTTGYMQQNQSCYTFKSSQDNKTLYIQPGNLSYTCNQDGEIITPPSSEKFYGQLQCPTNMNLAIYAFNECIDQCNKRGICINQQCICMKGYYGVTCKSVCNKYRYKLNCVSSCPTGTFVNEDIKVCLGCPYSCQSCTLVGSCNACVVGFYLKNNVCERDYSIPIFTSLLYPDSLGNLDNQTELNKAGILFILLLNVLFL